MNSGVLAIARRVRDEWSTLLLRATPEGFDTIVSLADGPAPLVQIRDGFFASIEAN